MGRPELKLTNKAGVPQELLDKWVALQAELDADWKMRCQPNGLPRGALRNGCVSIIDLLGTLDGRYAPNTIKAVRKVMEGSYTSLVFRLRCEDCDEPPATCAHVKALWANRARGRERRWQEARNYPWLVTCTDWPSPQEVAGDQLDATKTIQAIEELRRVIADAQQH